MVGRRGRTSLGCLVALLLLAALGYFAANLGQVYLHFYRYQDAMTQEVRFAGKNGDEVIRRHLRALADSLGLPDGAQQIMIRRTPGHISIASSYEEQVEMPMFVRVIPFAPRADGAF